MRGSFQEIADLFREYGLKHDDSEFSKAIESALLGRPSIEALSEELEDAGLEDIDVEIRQTQLSFDSGRAFVEDPVSRLLIIPEIRTWLAVSDLHKPLEYVRDAIDKYWSEGKLRAVSECRLRRARVSRLEARSESGSALSGSVFVLPEQIDAVPMLPSSVRRDQLRRKRQSIVPL